MSSWNLLSSRVGGHGCILRAAFSYLFSFFIERREERKRERRPPHKVARRRSLCGPGISYTRIMRLPGSRQHHETVTRETGPASNAYGRTLVGVATVYPVLVAVSSISTPIKSTLPRATVSLSRPVLSANIRLILVKMFAMPTTERLPDVHQQHPLHVASLIRSFQPWISVSLRESSFPRDHCYRVSWTAAEIEDRENWEIKDVPEVGDFRVCSRWLREMGG